MNYYEELTLTLQEFCSLLVSFLTSLTGQFFFKAGATKLGKVGIHNAVSHIIRIITIMIVRKGFFTIRQIGNSNKIKISTIDWNN